MLSETISCLRNFTFISGTFTCFLTSDCFKFEVLRLETVVMLHCSGHFLNKCSWHNRTRLELPWIMMRRCLYSWEFNWSIHSRPNVVSVPDIIESSLIIHCYAARIMFHLLFFCVLPWINAIASSGFVPPLLMFLPLLLLSRAHQECLDHLRLSRSCSSVSIIVLCLCSSTAVHTPSPPRISSTVSERKKWTIK